MAEKKSKPSKALVVQEAQVITGPLTQAERMIELAREVERVKEQRKLRAASIRDPQSLGEIMPDVTAHINQIALRAQEIMSKHRDKFTPIIQAQPQKRVCNIHEDHFELLDFEATMQASYKPDELVLVYHDCPECEHHRLVNEKHRQWLNMGIPSKTAHATFSNFITEDDPSKVKALEKVKRQAEKRRGFFILCGTHGTGKTHLASAAIKYLGGGTFVTFGQLIGEMRECYDEGGLEKMVRKYQGCDNLVIDEVELLGKKNDRGEIELSQDIQPFLYRVLAYRFDRDRFTGLTSNEDLTTVLAILGKRLEDRIAQNYASANLTWESFRRKNREM